MLQERVSQQKAAYVAGFSLLAMAVLGPFAYLYVFQSLIVHDQAAETAANILAYEGLFRFAIASLIVVVILDIIVAWSLYTVFERKQRSLSWLAASFRIAYAAIFGVAVHQLLDALRILTDPHLLAGRDLAERYAQAMLNIDAFNNGWNTGLIIFGLHLLVLGSLMLRTNYFPRFLGILVIIAGFGYLADSFGSLLFSAYSLELSMYTFIGELLLIIWLFIRGKRGFPA